MARYEFAQVNVGFPIDGRLPEASLWKPIQHTPGIYMMSATEVVFASTYMEGQMRPSGPKKYVFSKMAPNWNLAKYCHCSMNRAILVRAARPHVVSLSTSVVDGVVCIEAHEGTTLLWDTILDGEKDVTIGDVSHDIRNEIVARGRATGQSQLTWMYNGKVVAKNKKLFKVKKAR